MEETPSPSERDLSMAGTTWSVEAAALRERACVHQMQVVGTTIRPENLPAAQPGLPMFALSMAYGPENAEELDLVQLTVDLTLEQLSALGQTITDCLSQMMGSMVEASLDAYLGAEPGAEEG
jgi:hypothetical protein